MLPRPGPQRLRYHFDALPQARAHIHLLANRQLLFFPDPTGRLHERQPVLLELYVGDSDQPTNAAGEVSSVEAGIHRGAWIDLFTLSLHQLRTAQRKHRRVAADLLVRVERPTGGGMVLRLVDVSVGGARLAGGGFAFRPGDLVRLADLENGPAASALVLWSRNGEMAVQFDRAQQPGRVGASRLLHCATAKWNDALHAHHPAGCECGVNGRLMEPLLPRSAQRHAEGF